MSLKIKNTYKLSPTTFGDSPAAQNLTKILMQRFNKKEINKVGGVINYYQSLFKECSKMDKAYKETVLKILRRVAFERITNQFDEIVASHTRNVIATSYKYYLYK